MTELRKRGPGSKPVKPFQMKKTTKGESKTQNESSVNTILRGIFKVLLFIIVVPPMLNYAGLQKEREFLTSNLTRYDIGFGDIDIDTGCSYRHDNRQLDDWPS